MKTTDLTFIALVSKAIVHNQKDDGFFCDVDWQEMYKLAIKNHLVAVMYDAVKDIPSLPEDIRKKWDFARFQIFVRQKKHFHDLISIVREIEAAGIDYAIFKGIVVAQAYPIPAYRTSSDSDILVDEADSQAVCQIIVNKGYKLSTEKGKAHVFVLENEETGHIIELHTTVYEDYEGKKIQMLREADLESPAKRISVEADGEVVRTFGHNEHLAYQMFHIIKHFMLEGANVRFFTDIALFINAHLDELSADYFWEIMDRLNYGFFCENFLTVCVRYFGLDESFMNGRKAKASYEVLESMIVDFIYQGDEDELRKSNWQLTATLEPYLVGERTCVKKSKLGRRLRFIFPKASELNENYAYAKKHPVLLPIAWVHRFFHKLRWTLFEREEQYTAVEKINIVDERLGLMGSVGLLDEE